MRELRNRGGAVIERVAGGETLTVTRDGEPVAELRPLPRRPLSSRELVERFRHLEPVDYERFRADIDELFEPDLWKNLRTDPPG
ncbi:MAG: type II toxin-antitoxin system prevent-host-death family antitoxin [Actinobacteria bacterium]|nr:type II toxin-antitoxin system prevent-host-death family antitoxin [Actinomycetota bacterium]